jgi:hypothetical protein
MIKRIYIGEAWGKARQDRQGVIVELEDSKGNVFRYIPTHEDVAKIVNLLEEVEILNKEKCKGVENG